MQISLNKLNKLHDYDFKALFLMTILFIIYQYFEKLFWDYN